jgi:hypothetical protein
MAFVSGPAEVFGRRLPLSVNRTGRCAFERWFTLQPNFHEAIGMAGL